MSYTALDLSRRKLEVHGLGEGGGTVGKLAMTSWSVTAGTWRSPMPPRPRASRHSRPRPTRSTPGIGPILAYTIASEVGDISRFASAKRFVGYTGLCLRVNRSGETDWRGALTKTAPKYLRWALIEAATHAARHPNYQKKHERTKRRLRLVEGGLLLG